MTLQWSVAEIGTGAYQKFGEIFFDAGGRPKHAYIKVGREVLEYRAAEVAHPPPPVTPPPPIDYPPLKDSRGADPNFY